MQSSVAQKSKASEGGEATGTGGNVSYSLGQITYTTVAGAGGKVSQGVQQPFEIVTLGTDNYPEITLIMSVYPNPTTSFVNLKVDDSTFENLQFYLSDVTGKQLQSQKILEIETQINLENLPTRSIFFKCF